MTFTLIPNKPTKQSASADDSSQLPVLQTEARSAARAPEDGRVGWRLTGPWGRLSQSASSLASSGGAPGSPGCARRTGSRWTMESCDLEWDVEDTGQ